MSAVPRPEDDPVVGPEPSAPAEGPAEDAHDRRRRIPVPTFFIRRAFHSKDTGRWHKRPGGGSPEREGPAS